MSSIRLNKLVIRLQRTELKIQGLNSELGLKELDLKEISKEINQIKNRNNGVLNLE